MPTPEISVLIPTLNEEKNLERCLRACSWSDDIVVFDSFSADRTVEIAKDCGARVRQEGLIHYAFDKGMDAGLTSTIATAVPKLPNP